MIKYFIPLLVLGLSSCGGSNDDSGRTQATDVVIQTVASDYSGSDIQMVDLETNEASTGLAAKVDSDYILETNGEFIYQIGRYGLDNFIRFSIEDGLLVEQAQFDLIGDSGVSSSNTYALVFSSPTKAYLIRYGDNKIWIVNPQADNQEAFKLGELDISAYDVDDTPEASAAIIVDSKLYVAMQRMENWSPVEKEAMVAVFDVATDTEIDTNPNDEEENLKGFALPIHNVGKFEYHSALGLLLQGVGDVWANPETNGRDASYTSGVVSVNTNDYSVEVLIDDGDDESHPYGHIADFTVVNEDTIYFLGLAGWGSATLFQYNVDEGLVEEQTNDVLIAKDLNNLTSSPSGNVWVSVYDATNPHILILDDAQNEVDTIELNQNASVIKFINVE